MMLLMVLLTLATAPQNADPLEPARSGTVLCYAPDTTRQTCCQGVAPPVAGWKTAGASPASR